LIFAVSHNGNFGDEVTNIVFFDRPSNHGGEAGNPSPTVHTIYLPIAVMTFFSP
jgi:hypothetical protein